MDKKTLPLVIILAILVFAYWPILEFLGLASEPDPQPVATDTVQTGFANQPPAQYPVQTVPSGNGNGNPDLLAVQKLDQEPALDQMNTSEISATAETITINTNKYTITLSSLGGAPNSIILKEHSLRDGTPIDMLGEAESATPEAIFGGGTWTTERINFLSDLPAGTYEVTSSPYELTYTYTNEAGGRIIRHYTFYPNKYHYDLDFQVTDPASFGFESRYSMNWQTPMSVAEPNPKTDYQAMEAVAMQAGGRETLDDYDDNKLNQQLSGQTIWAGLRNKYFSVIMIPTNRAAESVSARGTLSNIWVGEDDIEKRQLSVALQMQFVSTTSIADSFTIFVGPLDYTLMAEYNVGLEDMLDIGTTPYVGWIIKPFAMGIIWILPKMYDIIPNYGWVIILFAFLVKVITLPLSMKSFKSMQAMKDLAPEIEKIKEKYKKKPNSQQMNKETMGLYKKHGVNPMAGCLPMLPQMPLFFALFSVFRSTILLRDAPWFWFIDDLSRGAQSFTDPYMILVVFMVAAQFISQKMTMGTNPQNKMMMYMMPLFMGFIFRDFAAGLVLYWACFSIFSLLDWVLFKRKAQNNQVKTA